jgi:hypothetical protein
MKRGVPPTALNARTGEFTPPGMTAQASSNSFAETSVRTSTSVPAAAGGFTTGCSWQPVGNIGHTSPSELWVMPSPKRYRMQYHGRIGTIDW